MNKEYSIELIKLIRKELSNIGISDIYKALSRIEKRNRCELCRLKVNRDVVIDGSKMFGVSINDAIEYLKTFDRDKKAILEQRWEGYGNNYFVVTKEEVENDEEYRYRISRTVEIEVDRMREEEKSYSKKA